jgi:drug/metabolite transporter (DMT)-like permease
LDPLVFSWAFAALAVLLYLPLALGTALLRPVPPAGWGFIAGTMALHVAYFFLLSLAYRSGDLSLVYPVARGTGIALVPLVAVLALGERVSPAGAAAIATVVLGVLLVHLRGLRPSSPARLVCRLREPGLRYALCTGLVIATYSVWDARGVTLVAPPVYNYFVFLAQALAAAPVALGRGRAVLAHEWRCRRAAIVAAALLSPLAYLLVLLALTFSRVSYIAPARELGIVIGTLLGTLALHESYGRFRVAGSLLIVAGVFGLALAP